MTNSLPPLEIYLLGRVDYAEILHLQKRLVYDLGDRPEGAGSLILCEHPAMITVGRSGSRAHIMADDDQLQSMRLPVRWVNRGGGCVLHQPGQLAIYVAFPLRSPQFDLSGYLGQLHQMMIGVLDEFDLRGTTHPDHPGVFLDSARVATIGVAVNRWIAYHGLTLNVSTFLEPFDLIREPSALSPGGVALRQTSMESRRQRPTPMSKVREAVIRHVETTLGLQRHHVYTHHPLIRRKVGTHDYVASPG